MESIQARLGVPAGLPAPSAPQRPDADEFSALEEMARTLTASGWYRVARRFERRDRYAEGLPSNPKLGLYVDVETTGLDPERDAIIEFAAVPFVFCSSGVLYTVGDAVGGLEDPERPIPESVTELTAITDEMVRGRRIDSAAVDALLADAVLVVAHNARFDRLFIERRFPAFADRHWACSQHDVPWDRHRCQSRGLEYLLLQLCGEFHRGHRAAEDCYAGVHVLSLRDRSGTSALAQLLSAARERTARLWAVGAPFEVKDQLKARRYRWNDGSNGKPRAWFRDVREPELEAERAWLREFAYGGKEPRSLEIEWFTARERYSARM